MPFNPFNITKVLKDIVGLNSTPNSGEVKVVNEVIKTIDNLNPQGSGVAGNLGRAVSGIFGAESQKHS